ncbi:MAG TPA: ACP S-malonyltransferase [Terriglobales bacterium]
MSDDKPQLAFLFPGQGSQAAGMGKELAAMYPVAQQTFDEADEALGYKLSTLCFEGPDDQLRMTEITQPAILTVSVAAYRVLESIGISPTIVAGHSLGEYSANVAAGTLTFADAVRTVRKRGKYMQEAVPVGQGAMAAVLNLAVEKIQEACDEALAASNPGSVCQPANINSPGQVVISGSAKAVEKAAELCKSKGAKRAIMLPVSAPFHCKLMQPAQDRLADDLKTLQFHTPKVPIMCNVDAALIGESEASRDVLTRQVTGAVRWEESVRKMIEMGVETFIEVGPGAVLTGLLRQIDKSKTGMNVENEATLQKVKNHFGQDKSKPE